MDYEKDLLADLGSDSEHDEQGEFLSGAEEAANETNGSDVQHEAKPTDLQSLLLNPQLMNVGRKLEQLDVSKIKEPQLLTSVHPLISSIRRQLQDYTKETDFDYHDLLAAVNNETQSEAYMFLMQLSDLPTFVSDEITLLHRYVRVHYSVVFPELESLVINPVDYCRVIKLIGQDLISIRSQESELKSIVSNDKVLAITMAALQQYTRQFHLSEKDMSLLIEACDLVLELSGFLKEISQFISSKLSKFAPNVSALIGPVATSQLLISVGSLKQLAATPACNLPSFGVKDLLSQLQTRSHFIRATGYLYYSELVRRLPPEITKQALRIVSGKVILAARIDVAGTSIDGEMGKKLLQEVETKIDKLLTPPDRVAPKALPAPTEQKSKKRGGRRFRKMKERFQMSELRKAQNKMEFGKQEEAVTDSFGQDIGLGLSKQLDSVKVNRNTDAKISKSMVSRLNSAKERKADLETVLLGPEETTTANGEKRGPETEEEGWFGAMKRRKA